MASRTTLKALLETGDMLTQTTLHNVIDSLAHVSEDDLATNASVTSGLSGKQATLVSGTNIKTINSTSLLGSGNIAIAGAGGDLLAANNLSDLANAATARTNLVLGNVDNTSDANKPVSAAQQAAIDAAVAGIPAGFAVITDATTSRTLLLTDARKYIRCTNAAAVSVIVPPQASVAWVADTETIIEQAGAGEVTIVAGAGVTLRASSTLKTRAQYSTLTLKRVALNEWAVGGDSNAVDPPVLASQANQPNGYVALNGSGVAVGIFTATTETEAVLNGMVLADGQIGVDTTQGKMWVGDGVLSPGVAIVSAGPSGTIVYGNNNAIPPALVTGISIITDSSAPVTLATVAYLANRWYRIEAVFRLADATNVANFGATLWADQNLAIPAQFGTLADIPLHWWQWNAVYNNVTLTETVNKAADSGSNTHITLGPRIGAFNATTQTNSPFCIVRLTAEVYTGIAGNFLFRAFQKVVDAGNPILGSVMVRVIAL